MLGFHNGLAVHGALRFRMGLGFHRGSVFHGGIGFGQV